MQRWPWCFVSVVLLFPALLHAAELKPYDKPIDPEGAYVCVDLGDEANDKSPVSLPAEIVEVGRIPFQVLAGADNDHLSVKPLGWSGGEDEAREYPGYMARYDDFPEPDDATRAAFRIPVHDYTAAWLLAATDDDPALTEHVTLRIGRFGRAGMTNYHDFAARVPRAGDAEGRRSADVTQVIPTEHGNLYLIRIPIARNFTQEFRDYWHLHLDVTRQIGIAINLPDPYRYQLRPVGDPSGVRIFGMTLERNPLEMEVVGREPGNVFNEPQKPTFDLVFRNHFGRPTYRVEVVSRRDDGVEQTFAFDEFRMSAPHQRYPVARQTVTLELPERGHYELTFNLYQRNELVLQHKTTAAVLAPDTRQYRHESPFGTWDFEGKHITPDDVDLIGSLAIKAGWRYARDSVKYGIESHSDYHLARKSGVEKLIEAKEQAGPDFTPPKRGMIFHEKTISGPHVLRTPDVFTGKTYTLTEDDQKRFDAMWERANTVYALVHEHFPQMQVYFGNGMPHLIEEFCRHGISKEDLRIAGNECGSFMRPPEAQPTDFISNNAGIFMFRRILDHYGYSDTKVYQCYEVTYPNTNPGNLTEPQQARYFVRNILHSLAWGIPKITPGLVVDVGNSYRFSNWGAAGFCHAYPNVSPKQSYVAYAVLTQVLDGAAFRRVLDTGSAVTYGLEFEKADGSYVYCLWTTHGKRPAELHFPESAQLSAMETLGRAGSVQRQEQRAAVMLTPDPVYVVSSAQLEKISLGKPTHDADADAGDAQVIDALDKLANWTVEPERNYELETYNFAGPRRQGDFVYREVAEHDGRRDVIGVTPKPVSGSEYLPMYSVLRLNEPVQLEGRPTEIGLWVHGNGGWGRVIFELEDAAGQRWVSLGAEMAGEPNPWMADWMPKEEFEKLQTSAGAGISSWNSNDAWGRSYINHEGWRFLRFPLPGNYGRNSDGYHWPYTSQWRFSKEPRVTYPLTFKKLIITLPEKVLSVDRYEPVRKKEVFLSDLKVTYRGMQELVTDD